MAAGAKGKLGRLGMLAWTSHGSYAGFDHSNVILHD